VILYRSYSRGYINRAISNGGRDPEKKDRQERHRPLVSKKNIDEATLSLLNSQKIGDLAIFFL